MCATLSVLVNVEQREMVERRSHLYGRPTLERIVGEVMAVARAAWEVDLTRASTRDQ
eukprot:SAG31_NODE_41856_length_274_cov_0.588571_1_plen_56_part_10